MKERVRALRENSLSIKPNIDVERAKFVTDVYKQYLGKVSTPVLRALTFKYIMENKKISIGEGELIVGDRGSAPMATPTYPEVCCHTVEDLEILDSREKISYSVSDNVKNLYKDEIIPFWKGRSIREKLFGEMSSSWKECYEAGIFTEFMEQRAPGHTVADGKIYKKGFREFIVDIDNAIKKLDANVDARTFDRKEELRAMKICAEAIITLAKRYSKLAREMADSETDVKRKAELIQISEVCSHVPEFAPRDFHEALQMYWFVHVGVITELNTWDAFNPGRLDQHLFPFYQSDIDKGMDKEDLKELLQCFWVKFNNQPAPSKVGVTAAESGTYTDFANINIGGLTVEGYDGVNEVSYMLLDVIEEMHILQPSSNIQLSRKNPDKFLKRACEVISHGYGFPSVFNADAVVEEMLRQGKAIEDARCGGTSGCVETGCFGKEAYILTGYLNLVKILEITLHNGIDSRTGKQIGLETGDVRNFDFYELIEAYKRQLHYFIDIKIKGNHVVEQLYAKYMPAPFLSIIVDDCIKKGIDYNAGGARYNTSYIQGVGIGTLTDCVSAIKKHVYDDKVLSIGDILDALDNNFDDKEDIRKKLSGDTPRYGNDDDYADSIMRMLFDAFYDEVNGKPNMRGGTYRIDMLPTTCHVYFGSVTGATPDGRRSAEPVSEGISPVQGTDVNGPTAVLKSAAKMDHLKTGGTLLNMKFSPQLFKNKVGIAKLSGLIRTYFRLDGHHIQFNVVNKKILLEAKENPDKYKSLIVRVAGYSDYFCNLTPSLQDEIILRTEHENI